ncbi:helix-turn-helix domain-containing protein [Amycolatopsis taiwanensis]|uniref:helix-turn-helix domain-containing protein n=1 Tax=Amycolatopsis taiwanensis TaxID=342230 RepID=UPI003CCB92FE
MNPNPTLGPLSENLPAPQSSALPPPHPDHDSGGTGSAGGNSADTPQGAGDPAQLLFTPAQAAAMLQVRESWLRRRAARRQVPCTFLGKHLRFSPADLKQITADAARPATTTRPTGPRPGTRPGRARSQSRTPPRRPDL